MICATCSHDHKPKVKCSLCHCAGAVEVHPQGKKPLEERYDPKAEKKSQDAYRGIKEPPDEEKVPINPHEKRQQEL